MERKISRDWAVTNGRAEEWFVSEDRGNSLTHYVALRKWFLLLSCAAVASPAILAQEPGWTSKVLKLGEERTISEQTPILERPYRPLHFYGNTVRRNHYRGNPWPMPRDLFITSAFLLPSSRERELEQQQRWGTGSLLVSPETGDETSIPALAAESDFRVPFEALTEDARNQESTSISDGSSRDGAPPALSSRTDSGESMKVGQSRNSDYSSRRQRRGRQ